MWQCTVYLFGLEWSGSDTVYWCSLVNKTQRLLATEGEFCYIITSMIMGISAWLRILSQRGSMKMISDNHSMDCSNCRQYNRFSDRDSNTSPGCFANYVQEAHLRVRRLRLLHNWRSLEPFVISSVV
jgi:hypothetical protein